MLASLFQLARLANLPTVVSNAVAAWLVVGSGAAFPPPMAMALSLVGFCLLYAGGCTLNDACDAGWDAQHRPERLIPSGRMFRRAVFIAAATEMAVGLGCIAVCAPAALGWALGLAAAIVLYDLWHKQNPLSVAIMGSCRWLLYLTAGVMLGSPDQRLIAAGGILFLYIVVLSLIARGESGLPRKMRWARGWLGPVPVALACVAVAHPMVSAGGFLGSAALIGAFFLPRPAHAGRIVALMLAAMPVLDFWIVRALAPETSWLWGVAFLGFFAAARAAQRWGAAT
jgi:hypothetical protein